MNKPGFGEANYGAVAGAIVGAIGGLFSPGLPEAIIVRDLSVLFSTPRIGLICLLIAGPIGWILGGQIGPRLARNPKGEGLLGALGGVVPVILIILWGWWYVTRA
jgi:hypothetical protein